MDIQTGLYSANYGGNLHSAASTITAQGLAEYLVTMSNTSGCNTVAVFKVPMGLRVLLMEPTNSHYTALSEWHKFPGKT